MVGVGQRGRRGGVGGFGGFVGAFGFAAAASDRDVAEDAPFGPVAAAVFAEVAGLGEVVVVVVTELGVERITAGALKRLVVLVVGSEPPVGGGGGGEKPGSSSCSSSSRSRCHGVYLLHLLELIGRE